MTLFEACKRGYLEPADAYVNRLQKSYLLNWPAEVLESYLWWGYGLPGNLVNLDFTKLSFRKQIWHREDMPGGEVFGENWIMNDHLQDVDFALKKPGYSWVVDYMSKVGTWNTPIIFLENRDLQRVLKTSYGEVLKQPFHLLEGHNRLTTLNRLIELGYAAEKHAVWVAQLAE